MRKAADFDALIKRLAPGEIVPRDETVWAGLAERFTVQEVIETGLLQLTGSRFWTR